MTTEKLIQHLLAQEAALADDTAPNVVRDAAARAAEKTYVALERRACDGDEEAGRFIADRQTGEEA